MPVTIKSNAMKYKNPSTGQYQGIDAIAETTTSQQVAAVQAAGTTQVGAVNSAGSAQVTAIQNKGNETIASIPSDYTSLSNEVTDLKSAIDDVNVWSASETGVMNYIFTLNAWIPTTTSSVDHTNVVSQSNKAFCVIDCQPGEIFHVKLINGNSTHRPWSFIASDGSVQSQAGVNSVEGDITAPENSAKLVLNTTINDSSTGESYGSYCYKGTSRINGLETRTTEIEKNGKTTAYTVRSINNLIQEETGIYNFIFTYGGWIPTEISTVNPENIEDRENMAYCVIECQEGDEFTVNVGYTNSSHRPWSFIGPDNSVKSQATSNLASDAVITAPEGATKLVLNTNVNSIEYYCYKGTSRINGLETRTTEIEKNELAHNLVGIFRTIGVVGDSLASGQGRINDLDHYHDFYEYSWPQCMARMLSATVYNFTESGLNTRTWQTSQYGYPLMSDGSHKCQCYIIGLGANDVALGSDYVGSSADIDLSDYHNNADTYYGNYAKIIQQIREIEPRSVIFTIENPVYGSSSAVRAALNTAVAYMSTIFDSVYNLPINKTMYSDVNGFIYKNKVKSHYTPAAYLYMANYLIRLMSDVIYENPEAFYFVNLIGTQYVTPTIPSD